jgi:15-cis-phytoene synthase
MTPALARSYAYCERVARREAGNFYYAFRVLPRAQRLAMCALYAFMRVADDLSDGAQPIPEKRRLIEAWGERWKSALAGRYTHRLHAAFHHAVSTYQIPHQYIEAVLAGVAMDLEPVCYETFAELYPYCYRVASAVGLACIHIWGFDGESAKEYAESAGIAFQMTNILRDLGEDAARGRIYLPREDLRRFGYFEDQLARGERCAAFRALMRFEVERTRGYYEAATPLVRLLQPAGRAVFLIMSRTYRGLLEAIERRDYDVFTRRVRLSRWHKLWLAARALPVRWGWA